MITRNNELVSAEKVRKLFWYDQNTGAMIWISPPKNHYRMLHKLAGTPRTKNGKSYLWVKIDGRAYSLSRVAFLWMTGEWPVNQIDHKDGDSLNNKWDNLREATKTQNAWNHKTRAKKHSLPMGVRETPYGFQARITKNKIIYSLGVFATADTARQAYEMKRQEFFGEFA